MSFMININRIMINSVATDEAASVIDENRKMITLEFVEGTHMVPNETPDIIGRLLFYV